ncbi:acyltransferase [Massilia sp. Root335]|uniref:acyltransferase family protein n=1 Tax=Massilia sp. Root335 TaxID=1736517 RepID=UPI000A96BFFA|nr:acyltransferase [Massilia sp. Root335]
MPPSKSHYEVLDGLRGTAAFCVLMFHFWEMLVPDAAHNPMRHTFLAVDFFFALSGFVLGHAYDARLAAGAQDALTLPGFFRRRLIRLHPMALAGLAIGVTAYLLDPFVGDTQRIGEKISLATLAGTIALSLFLLPTPNVPNSFGETHSLNGPSWTLFQEYIANVLYGFFGHKLTRRLHVGLCVASAAVLAWTACHFNDLGHGWGWADFWVAPVRLACPFLTGLLVYRLRLRLSVPQPFVLLSLVLVAVFVAPLMGRYNGLFEAGCVIVVFPLVLAAGAGVTRTQGATGALCRFMGELSYPVYIIHYGFVYVFAHWNWSTHPAPMRLGLVAAGVQVGIVILAYALLRWFDKPVRAWLTRKYADPVRVPAGAAQANV